MALNYACAGGPGRIMASQIVKAEQANILQSLSCPAEDTTARSLVMETPITTRQ